MHGWQRHIKERMVVVASALKSRLSNSELNEINESPGAYSGNFFEYLPLRTLKNPFLQKERSE